MANERERNTDDTNMDESLGGADRPGESSREQVGGKSEENLRGVSEDSDDDEFEEADDLDDDEEEESDGTV